MLSPDFGTTNVDNGRWDGRFHLYDNMEENDG